MPYTRTTRKYYRRKRKPAASTAVKRTYKRKWASKPKTFGQPRAKIVNMPYHATVALSGAAAGLANVWQFRVNSIHDPDLTGAGHQPLTHDQWALFYNHYVVSNCSMTVQFNCPSVAQPMYIGVCLSDDATTSATGITQFDTLCENKHVRYQLISTNDAGKTVTMRYHVDPLKFLGRNAFSTDVKTSFGSNPTELAYFTLFCVPVDASYTAPSVWCSVTLNFKVKLLEPKELAAS